MRIVQGKLKRNETGATVVLLQLGVALLLLISCDNKTIEKESSAMTDQGKETCTSFMIGVWELDSVELYSDGQRLITILTENNTFPLNVGSDRYRETPLPYRALSIPNNRKLVEHYTLSQDPCQEDEKYQCAAVNKGNWYIWYYDENIDTSSETSMYLKPFSEKVLFKRVKCAENDGLIIEYSVDMEGNIADLNYEYYSKLAEGHGKEVLIGYLRNKLKR